MNAEFNWWLLIVGLVIGAGLVWLVLADSRRREVDVLELEREGEAIWIAETMVAGGSTVDRDDVLEVLRLHADYLAAGPPDEAWESAGGGHPADDEFWTAVAGRAAPGQRPVDGKRTLMAHPIARPDPDEVSGA